ncbi:hypothetical protein C9J60_23755 [Streptomyces sp. A244]|nr:hypothetical protein C9J60_23755 [Streptomyces sp. A244]
MPLLRVRQQVAQEYEHPTGDRHHDCLILLCGTVQGHQVRQAIFSPIPARAGRGAHSQDRARAVDRQPRGCRQSFGGARTVQGSTCGFLDGPQVTGPPRAVMEQMRSRGPGGRPQVVRGRLRQRTPGRRHPDRSENLTAGGDRDGQPLGEVLFSRSTHHVA